MWRDVLQAFSQSVYEKRHLASSSLSIRSDVCTSAYMKQRNFHLKGFQKISYFGLLSNILDTYFD